MANRKLIVEIVGDDRSLKRALGSSSAAAGQFEGRMKSATSSVRQSVLGMTAVFLGTGGAIAVLKGAVNAASNLNEQTNKVGVVFGKSSREVVLWAKTTTKSLGIANDQALEYAGTFGNMLVPMGFAKKEAASMSVQLVKLAADMASFNNANPKEVLEALRSGLAGEVEPLRRFGVQLSDVRERQVLTEAGVKNLGTTLTAQQKSWAAYQIILKDTANAQGDFQRTSGGLANQQRILTAQLRDLMGTIGAALLPTVRGITTAMTEWLGKTENQKKVQDAINGTMRAAKEILGGIRDVVGAVNRVTGGFKQTLELLLALKVAAKLGVWTNALTGLTGATGGGGLLGASGASATLLKNLRLLAAMGPIPVAVVVKIIDSATGNHIANWLYEDKRNPFVRLANWLAKIEGLSGGGPTVPVPNTGKVISPIAPLARTGAGIQVPSSFMPTHQTSGLPGFPAVDIMAKGGTKVLAPEDGQITRHSGSDPALPPQGQGGAWGWSLYYIGARTGNTYFMTHLQWAAPLGSYKKGQTIGLVGDYPGSTGSHVHVGVQQGKAQIAVAAPGGAKAPSSGVTAKTVTAAASSFALPMNLQMSLEVAKGTTSSADDLKALRSAESWITQHIKGLTGAKKLEALQALHDIQNQITTITDAATAKRVGREKAAQAAQQARWKANLERLKQIVESKRSVFEAAFQAVAEKALEAFDRETQRGLAALQSQYGEETPQEAALRRFQEARALEERAQARKEAMAIQDPVERAARLRELDLQDQEAVLQKAADESRAARNKQLDEAQAAYEEDRANRREALVGWLADQKLKLDAGLLQWDDFFIELKDKAFLGGIDVGSAFWEGFNQAAAAAKVGLNAVEMARAATRDLLVPVSGTAHAAAGYFALNPPSMAGGGIVPGALGQPKLILAHGGETVTPPGVGGTNFYFNFPNYLGDKRELVDTIRNELNRSIRRGSTLVAS